MKTKLVLLNKRKKKKKWLAEYGIYTYLDVIFVKSWVSLNLLGLSILFRKRGKGKRKELELEDNIIY